MNLYAQDGSELQAIGTGRMWLCRLLRPTLGKKFLLIFSALAVTGVANGWVIEATLSKMHGMTAVVNVTGSLRWLSQRIYADTARIMLGVTRDRAAIEDNLALFDEAIRSLETGGSVQGIEIQRLPDNLKTDIAYVRAKGASLRDHARRVLAGLDGDSAVRPHLDFLYQDGTRILETADAIAAALTRESERAEDEARRNLLRLGLLDLALLVGVLLGIRRRIVHPLRKLAAVSRGFAEGRRELRSGFHSLDEIGQVAEAFDSMADEIERDMRQLGANAAELESREQGLRKFSLAIEHSPVSVVITDAAGAIEYVNAKFAEATGYTREETLGRQPSILKSGCMPDKVYADLWQTLQRGQEWHGELLNRKKNGELFWEDTSIAPLKDAQGRISHFVAVKEDITRRKRAEEVISNHGMELERRVAERTHQLQESNRELEAFSYSISHDLRAPLRGINGFAGLMAENCQGCGKTESLEYMARIQRASVRMGNLIDDLLDLSRLTRSAIRIGRVDLAAMARSILDELAAAQPSRQMQIDIQDDLLVNGDATLLQDMLENLLGNAWKFTAGREPAHIAFGCREEAGEKGERVFFVHDNGAGFDMKYADKLFGAFQRLHGINEFDGNGIGLAMVQRIVALHGGRVWAEGVLGEGAIFYFTLGAGLPAAEQGGAMPPAGEHA